MGGLALTLAIEGVDVLLGVVIVAVAVAALLFLYRLGKNRPKTTGQTFNI